MGICETHGVDHHAEALEHAEDYAHLECAWQAVADENEKNGNGFLSGEIRKFIRMMNRKNKETFIHYAMHFGVEEGPDLYVEMMMEVIFCVGVLTGSRFGEGFPSYTVGDEDVQRVREGLERAIAAEESQVDLAQVREALAKFFEQEGVEGIEVMSMDEMKEKFGLAPGDEVSASDSAPVSPDNDQPIPGNYL